MRKLCLLGMVHISQGRTNEKREKKLKKNACVYCIPFIDLYDACLQCLSEILPLWANQSNGTFVEFLLCISAQVLERPMPVAALICKPTF